MADGKREHDYDVAINLAGYVNACLSGKFNPNTANPVRAEVQNALIEANSDPKGAEAFLALRAGLEFIAESWPKEANNGNGTSFQQCNQGG
jgi:hypothetical protein